MFAFIFAILVSVLVAYFATQNTELVTIHFATNTWTGIPLYLLMLTSLLAGLLFAWIFHILSAISASFALRSKNKKIKQTKEENLELTKKVHQLEIENTKLSTKDSDSLIEKKSL